MQLSYDCTPCQMFVMRQPYMVHQVWLDPVLHTLAVHTRTTTINLPLLPTMRCVVKTCFPILVVCKSIACADYTLVV